MPLVDYAHRTAPLLFAQHAVAAVFLVAVVVAFVAVVVLFVVVVAVVAAAVVFAFAVVGPIRDSVSLLEK